ncbi:lef-6 [Hyphantria cunea granulovirus]|uniref:Lef-6 n=1 Tax=Hyphantria cunea granulovirus TaxID=307448 RepID=A0AAE6D0L9_9BBAC|nr:lef-6 [Hyphantria cunea granulovirus]QBQ01620.1 lef-6 [Hyphantria cunea granulovirus]
MKSKLRVVCFLSHPLWLTKMLLLYMCNEHLIRDIDWTKSNRFMLTIKKKSTALTLDKLKFFYPDGTIGRLKLLQSTQL